MTYITEANIAFTHLFLFHSISSDNFLLITITQTLHDDVSLIQ